MNYSLIVKPAAAKQLRRLPEKLRSRALEKMAKLQTNPRSGGALKLAGSMVTWRVRFSDYRIVYEIHDDERTVFVTIIAHRREVYRDT